VILDTLQIVTPWMDVPREGRTAIVIDPGQAFGTGGHATTRLILKMIEKRARRGGLPETLLDVGTGSGVLAIAAMKLGAREVLGIDVEEEAVDAATENADRNGIHSGFTTRVCTAGALAGRWPLVLANLQLDVFLTAATEIAERVETDGEILVSGILTGQEETCIRLWPGFERVERAEDGEWVALAMRRG
jgi:ribosomal protein L11 methyltransferase